MRNVNQIQRFEKTISVVKMLYCYLHKAWSSPSTLTLIMWLNLECAASFWSRSHSSYSFHLKRNSGQKQNLQRNNKLPKHEIILLMKRAYHGWIRVVIVSTSTGNFDYLTFKYLLFIKRPKSLNVFNSIGRCASYLHHRWWIIHW